MPCLAIPAGTRRWSAGSGGAAEGKGALLARRHALEALLVAVRAARSLRPLLLREHRVLTHSTQPPHRCWRCVVAVAVVVAAAAAAALVLLRVAELHPPRPLLRLLPGLGSSVRLVLPRRRVLSPVLSSLMPSRALNHSSSSSSSSCGCGCLGRAFVRPHRSSLRRRAVLCTSWGLGLVRRVCGGNRAALVAQDLDHGVDVGPVVGVDAEQGGDQVVEPGGVGAAGRELELAALRLRVTARGERELEEGEAEEDATERPEVGALGDAFSTPRVGHLRCSVLHGGELLDLLRQQRSLLRRLERPISARCCRAQVAELEAAILVHYHVLDFEVTVGDWVGTSVVQLLHTTAYLRKDAQHLPLGKCFAPSCSDHVRQLPARTVLCQDVQRLASSSVWNNRVRDVPDDVGMRRDLLHHFRFLDCKSKVLFVLSVDLLHGIANFCLFLLDQEDEAKSSFA
mmetsp:Transcript_28990/g.69426  ORF Transcript_28990/g.69426 Transcript_28990/m.69426 type:complete len:455 (+) Transcript_28990:194-1558(+)